LPEIEEKLTLIPYTRLLLSTDKNKEKFIYNPTKRTINWGKYVHFVKIFYTKVSHRRRLTVASTQKAKDEHCHKKQWEKPLGETLQKLLDDTFDLTLLILC